MQLPRQLTISKTSKKKSQWIICRRLNTQTLREVNKDREMKKTDTETETELKNECLCDISHWALWLASPSAKFWPLTVRMLPCVIHWAALSVDAVREGDVIVDVWVKHHRSHLRLSSAYPYLSSLLMCASGFAQPLKKTKKTVCGYISCWCRFHAVVTQLLSFFGLSSP